MEAILRTFRDGAMNKTSRKIQHVARLQHNLRQVRTQPPQSLAIKIFRRHARQPIDIVRTSADAPPLPALEL